MPQFSRLETNDVPLSSSPIFLSIFHLFLLKSTKSRYFSNSFDDLCICVYVFIRIYTYVYAIIASMIVAVASSKGGTGKTTSAMMIAAGLSKTGPTLVIDADKQGSALSWARKVDEIPFEVITAAKLTRDIPKWQQNYEHIVVDCPPGDMTSIGAAIRSAEHVIITAQPTPADLDKIIEVDEIALEEQDDHGLPTVHVLLTRVIKRTIAQLEARQIIENNEIAVFDTEIFNKQALAMQHSDEIDPNELYGYQEVVDELLAIHKGAI